MLLGRLLYARGRVHINLLLLFLVYEETFFFFFKLEKSILLFFHPHKLNFGLWPQVMGNDIEVNFLPL